MDTTQLLAFARSVCLEYQEAGYLITLRQLYYQGVARGLLPSGQKTYDRLGAVLSKARLDGTFPLNWLVDRTRTVHPGRTTLNNCNIERAAVRAAEATRRAPETFLGRDRWFGQPNHVSVWFEKDALSGIFEAACGPLGVSWFACRGDASHSAVYQWLERTAPALGVDNAAGWRDAHDNAHKGMAKRAVILYFGDHDPTGVRIPRTLEDTLRRFQEITGAVFPLEFQRVALSVEQARARNLPPFPAKIKSADYKKYVDEFETTDAWELDALEPTELQRMVEEAVTALFDVALYASLQGDIEKRRLRMRNLMQTTAWREAATTWED